jgi:sirohydrochlorin cobaltochelatase
MSGTVLIAAHGSHLDPRSSEPVHRHAATLRRSGRFDRVLTGFWKEEPALCRSLDGVGADRVVVVPFFMADGYFTRTIIPRELAQCFAGELCITSPVGLAPGVTDLVAESVRVAGATASDTVVVLGHGTPRNETSAAAAACHAAKLAATGEFARVLPLYLDQEPSIAGFNPAGCPGRLIVVPLFVSDGWHVGTSIPDAMASGPMRDAVLTPAVGTLPAAADVIAALALTGGRSVRQ